MSGKQLSSKSGFKIGNPITIPPPSLPDDEPIVPLKQGPSRQLSFRKRIGAEDQPLPEPEQMSNECTRCKWEYKRIHENGEEHLDSLGQDSWELCAVVQRTAGELWIFKRPIK